MLKWFKFLNPILEKVGRRIIELHIGHWFVKDGKLTRVSLPSGRWRIMGRSYWEGLPENATDLDRFAAANADRIGALRKTLSP